MQVMVEGSVCAGYGQCVIHCPEWFGLDDFGHAFVLDSEVPPELEAKVMAAMAACPSHAIVVT